MPRSLRSPLQERLREILIEARKAKKLSQADIAVRLSRPQSFVAKYEIGERRLDVVEFVEVVEAIGADPVNMLKQLLAEQ